MELDRDTAPYPGREDVSAHAGGEPAAPGVEADWSRQRPAAIVCHLIEHFHDPLRQNLSQLSLMLDQVRTRHDERHPALFAPLSATFRALKWELLLHLEKEERVLFPLITRIDEAIRTGEPTLPAIALAAPISQMESEHADTARALDELRQITGNFTPPADTDAGVCDLYRRLRELDEETQVHVRLESDVLFPRTLALAAHQVA
jgi:regulator of cell morphogenesis and NO signaling